MLQGLVSKCHKSKHAFVKPFIHQFDMLFWCEVCVMKPSACCKVTLSAASVLLLQLREDVTRYRYGDEQHLDESLTKIFMFNRVRNTLKVTPFCIASIMSPE